MMINDTSIEGTGPLRRRRENTTPTHPKNPVPHPRMSSAFKPGVLVINASPEQLTRVGLHLITASLAGLLCLLAARWLD